VAESNFLYWFSSQILIYENRVFLGNILKIIVFVFLDIYLTEILLILSSQMIKMACLNGRLNVWKEKLTFHIVFLVIFVYGMKHPELSLNLYSVNSRRGSSSFLKHCSAFLELLCTFIYHCFVYYIYF
jgi:hypothetical protein